MRDILFVDVEAARQNVEYALDGLWDGIHGEAEIIGRLRDADSLLGGTWHPDSYKPDRRRVPDWLWNGIIAAAVAAAVLIVAGWITGFFERESDIMPALETLEPAESILQPAGEGLECPLPAGVTDRGWFRAAADSVGANTFYDYDAADAEVRAAWRIAVIDHPYCPGIEANRVYSDELSAAATTRALLGYITPTTDAPAGGYSCRPVCYVDEEENDSIVEGTAVDTIRHQGHDVELHIVWIDYDSYIFDVFVQPVPKP